MAYSALEAVIVWLSAQGYRASTVVPAEAPAEFVTVERTGGTVDGKVDHPTFAIRTWAKTYARAEEMALEIRNAAALGRKPTGIHAFTGITGPYPIPDEFTGTPCQQLVLDASAQLAI